MIVLAALLLAGSPPPGISDAELRAQLANAPPFAPGGDETPTPAITDPDVQSCVTYQTETARSLRSTVVRVSATLSAKFGPLWRADIASSDHPPIVTRLVCSRTLFLNRPLKMFDSSQDLAPLP